MNDVISRGGYEDYMHPDGTLVKVRAASDPPDPRYRGKPGYKATHTVFVGAPEKRT